MSILHNYQQLRRNSCGSACLHMLLAHQGRVIPESTLIRRLGWLKSYGIDTPKLASLARRIGFKADCLVDKNKPRRRGMSACAASSKILDSYLKRKIPVLLVIDANWRTRKQLRQFHNIVVWSQSAKKFRITDPSIGKSEMVSKNLIMESWIETAHAASSHLIAVIGKKND